MPARHARRERLARQRREGLSTASVILRGNGFQESPRVVVVREVVAGHGDLDTEHLGDPRRLRRSHLARELLARVRLGLDELVRLAAADQPNRRARTAHR